MQNKKLREKENTMERLKSKVFVALLIRYLICMLVSLPSFVYADVTIDTTVTGTQTLGDPVGTATVTNTGKIFSAASAAIFVSVDGWNINVRGLVSQFGLPNSWGIRFYSVGGIGEYRSGTLNNWGGIYGTGWGVSMGSGSITNYGGISGNIGIYGNGNTTILNYGTITGTGGTAISLAGTANQVTLCTDSVINGNIAATYGAGSANAFFLDGQGTIGASQIQNFNTLNKTGAGIWKLTGDKDYTSGGGQLMPVTVYAGILAFGERGAGGGVTTSSFTQTNGSLGFAVQAPGLTDLPATNMTGALKVTGAANFNNGTIVVIPTAGTYPKTTTYLNVLTVGAAFDAVNTKWSQVTSTSAFLSPTLVEQGTSQVYDLILNRLSFTTGALTDNKSLGLALDGMYDDATGDMRNILDQLLFISPGDVQRIFTQMGGGTLSAFQFMSFYGLNQYHGALNNHLGGGSGFTGGLGNGMAANQYGYPQGMQMAFAAGGNTISDITPMLLAMAGSLLQG